MEWRTKQGKRYCFIYHVPCGAILIGSENMIQLQNLKTGSSAYSQEKPKSSFEFGKVISMFIGMVFLDKFATQPEPRSSLHPQPDLSQARTLRHGCALVTRDETGLPKVSENRTLGSRKHEKSYPELFKRYARVRPVRDLARPGRAERERNKISLRIKEVTHSLSGDIAVTRKFLNSIENTQADPAARLLSCIFALRRGCRRADKFAPHLRNNFSYLKQEDINLATLTRYSAALDSIIRDQNPEIQPEASQSEEALILQAYIAQRSRPVADTVLMLKTDLEDALEYLQKQTAFDATVRPLLTQLELMLDRATPDLPGGAAGLAYVVLLELYATSKAFNAHCSVFRSLDLIRKLAQIVQQIQTPVVLGELLATFGWLPVSSQ